MDFEINKRLKLFIDDLGVTPYAFSKKMGNKRAETLYKILDNKVSPSAKTLEKIKNNFPELNYSWLLTGEGSMKKNAEVGKMHTIDEEQANYEFEDDAVLTIRQDIKAVNENLLKLSEGVTVNFERVGGALFEALKGQQKILKFIEQIDADRINKATGKLDEFLESR